MAKKNTLENTLACFTHGHVEAVVILKEAPFDRYRYPAFIVRRRCLSKAGKPLSPQNDFFEYNTDELINAAKDARAFIKRYQQNPKAALDELSRRQSSDVGQLAA